MKLIRFADSCLLAIVSLASIILLVFHHFSLFESIEFIKVLRYEALVLALLATIGMHLVVVHYERTRFHDAFEGGAERLTLLFREHADRLIDSVHGVDVRVFASVAEQELYMAKRIEEAEVEICDLSWKEKISHLSTIPQRIKAHKTYEQSISKAAKKVPYREVFVFSDMRRKDKLKRRLEENTAGYSCRYFPEACKIPRLQFLIIDKKEIIFASSSYPTFCSLRQEELGKIFQAYFDAIWGAAEPLKDGDYVYKNEVEKVLGIVPTPHSKHHE